ncbi:MAG: zinc finger MYND domain-containing protein [archaeon]|nr:zinc finger MYND domain-containing protein [archaeon]
MEKTNPNPEKHNCNKPGCSNESKLRCPNCIKLGIKNESYFCGKDCFKSFWSEHKKIHELCKIYIIIYY